MIKIKRWLNKYKIEAINDEHLKNMLTKNGILDEELNRKLICAYCNREIRFDEITSIKMEGKEIALICDSFECIKKVIEE